MAEELGTVYLPVVPSLKGASGVITKELSASSKTAGTAAGQQLGTSMATTASQKVSKASNLFGGLIKSGALGVVASAGAALGGALFAGFNRLNNIDQARAKLIGLGNDAKTVDEVMSNALSSVQGTAFGLDEAATTAGSLVAAGIKPGQQLAGVLKTVADTASIAGSSMDDMGLIFGSVAARGKLQGDDLMQLQSRGIPVLATLAKHYKTTAEEASKMVSKGEVDFKDFAEAMHEKVGGAALKSGDTFSGAMDNMHAALGRVGAGLLSGVFPKLQSGITGLTKDLDSLQGPATAVGTALGNVVTVATSLPGPVNSVAAALVALKVAQKFGVTSAVTSGLETARIQAMLTADSYRALEAETNRLRATTVLAGRAAGSGLTKGLSGAMSLVGGPWGAAFLAGTAIATHFWQAHQAAKQHVSDLTAALNEETGALTENYKQLVITSLQQRGAFDVARSMGISLDLVTKAALGNKKALADVNAGIQEWYDRLGDAGHDVGAVNFADKLKNAIGDETSAMATSREQWEQRREAQQGATRATEQDTSATKANTEALFKHIDAMNKDRDAALQGRQDRLSLIQQMQATSKEAREGAVAFGLHTAEGQKNRTALYQLAQQWNSSADSVQKSRGLYAQVRKEFIRDAVQMGATRAEARKLARELLHVPKRLPLDTSQALTAIQRLQKQLDGLHDKSLAITVRVNASHAQAVINNLGDHSADQGNGGGNPRAEVPGWTGPGGSSNGFGGFKPRAAKPTASPSVSLSHSSALSGPVQVVLGDDVVSFIEAVVDDRIDAQIGA